MLLLYRSFTVVCWYSTVISVLLIFHAFYVCNEVYLVVCTFIKKKPFIGKLNRRSLLLLFYLYVLVNLNKKCYC